MSHSPPSSPESSHVTTVYSQGPPSQTSVFARGPPSQNTRSSTMNRSLPSTTPPASYRTALLHIQQRERNEAQLSHGNTTPVRTRSPSIHSTPSSPVPLSHLEPEQPVSSSPFIPIRHSTSSPSPSRYQPPSDHHPTQQITSTPDDKSLSHSSPSQVDTDSHPRWSSPASMTPSLSRYKLMQEHMDNMHNDIASLGHKHDFTYTAINELRDNIGCIDNNMDVMKELITTMAEKIQTITPSAPPVTQPSIVPSTVPSHVPSAIPLALAPDLPQSRILGPRPSQIPNRVPTHNLHTLSQASSFTSIPQLTTQNHRSKVRDTFPLSTQPNSVRNLAEHNLDSDLSLGSDQELHPHVPNVGPPPITGREKIRKVRVSDSQKSPTQNSRIFPTTDDNRASQTNTPVINNSIIHSVEPTSQFNSNYFLLLLDEIPKIKYSAIESSLSKRVLDDDTNQSLQKLY